MMQSPRQIFVRATQRSLAAPPRSHRLFSSRSSLLAEEKGASQKSPRDAQPKILKDNLPAEHEVSEDVKKHNEELSKRADKPQEKVKDEDVEKDKVRKGYWSGEGAGRKD